MLLNLQRDIRYDIPGEFCNIIDQFGKMGDDYRASLRDHPLNYP